MTKSIRRDFRAGKAESGAEKKYQIPLAHGSEKKFLLRKKLSRKAAKPPRV